MTPEEVYVDVLRSGSEPENPSQEDSLHPALLEPRADFFVGEDGESSPLLSSKGDAPRRRRRSRVSNAVRGCISSLFSGKRKQWKNVKVIVLFAIVVAASFMFGVSNDEEEEAHLLVVSSEEPSLLRVPLEHPHAILEVKFRGPFVPKSQQSGINLTSANQIVATVSGRLQNGTYIRVAKEFVLLVNDNFSEVVTTSFTVEGRGSHSALYFSFKSSSLTRTPISVEYEGLPAGAEYQELYAGLILVFVYILIVFELVHRTVAAMIGSLLALATLSLLNKRPTLEKTVQWIDFETIGLLFGMMTLVGVFSNTGVFDWLALKAYKIAKGKIWPLITLLCMFSGIVSAFLDNVTTILLLTPVSIRLCQVLNLDPTRVLMAEVVFSNIGGTATAVGDPPNVIIVSNKAITDAGITFATFTLHMFVGITFCMAAAYALLRVMYRKLDLANVDPPEVAELKREVQVWRRTAIRVPIVSAEQKVVRALLMQKMLDVEQKLRDEMSSHRGPSKWKDNLADLEQKYRITDRPLLVKSSIVLVVVILFFFLHSVPDIHMGLGWIAILGAVWLLVLADIHDLEAMLEKIEWATLLFFAALFVLMEALGELGLISMLGDKTSDLIKSVPEDHRLSVAIVSILWLSAIASSFIDNIPFTTAMIPIVITLGNDPDVNLPLPPLVWALAMGACLGGNGTLIGASANVVCAGIAEQHGYPISFNMFFKIGFPMMLVTNAVAMVYLLVCHSAAGWNSA